MNIFSFQSPAKVLISALTAFFAVGCQHPQVSDRPLRLNPSYGSVSGSIDTAQAVLIPQWHLSPGDDTKIRKTNLPQTENQLAIFDEVSNWISDGALKTVVVEGCEGEIDETFKTRYNGWSLSDLKELSESQLRSTMTHIGLKLEATFGDQVRITCGDDQALIKKHLLILSDMRGLSGFKARIDSYKDNKVKRDDYIKSVKSLLKLPESTTDDKVVDELSSKLRSKVDDYEKVIAERNRVFARKVSATKGRSAVVIGALHIQDLSSQLQSQGIKTAVFTPTGIKGDEAELIEQVKRLTETR